MHIYITQLSQVKLQKNETMLYSLKNQKKQKNLYILHFKITPSFPDVLPNTNVNRIVRFQFGMKNS